MTMIKDFLEFHTKHNTCEHFLDRFLKLNNMLSNSIDLSAESLAIIAASNKPIDNIDLKSDFFETDISGLYDYNDYNHNEMNHTDLINLYKDKAKKYGFLFEHIAGDKFLVEHH